MLGALLAAMRPHQWVKNAFVIAPLVFAEQALHWGTVLKAALAFAVFSTLSGCVYLLNDLMDVEQDRRHPVKCKRPIASGTLPIPVARVAMALLLISSTLVAFVWLSPTFAAIGLSYFCLNVAYSFALKHIPFLDVVCIASGFLLRLVGGGVAIGVPVTPWILACTFLLALTLALGKRRHELRQAGEKGASQRKVLARYRLNHLTGAMQVLAVATALTYAAYTVWGTQMGHLFHPRDLLITIPFVVFGLFRFELLTRRLADGTSPTDAMLRDWPFLINIGLWALTVFFIIYLR